RTDLARPVVAESAQSDAPRAPSRRKGTPPERRVVIGRLGVRSEEEGGGGVLQHPGDVGQEARAPLAVDVPVVEAQGQRGHLAYDDLVVHDPRLLLDRAEGEDRGLTGVDDRRPAVDAEDT